MMGSTVLTSEIFNLALCGYFISSAAVGTWLLGGNRVRLMLFVLVLDAVAETAEGNNSYDAMLE